MEEQLISFETAKLAKEKGFDFIYIIDNELTKHSLITQSLLAKWLREVHNIIVDVSLDFLNSHTKESIKYSPTFYTYSNNKKRFWIYTDYINSDECTKKMQEEMPIFQNYSTYEEALEIGLQEALKLIK